MERRFHAIPFIMTLLLSAGLTVGDEPARIEVEFSGEDGANWPEEFILNDSGDRVTMREGRGEIRYQSGRRGAALAALEPADAASASGLDSMQEVTAWASSSTSGMFGGLFARRHDTAPETYYRAAMIAAHGAGRTFRIDRVVRGESRTLATLGRSDFWEIEEDYRIRFSVEQIDPETTRLRAKLWPADEPEPEEWTLIVDDQAPELQRVPGRMGLTGATASSSARYWRFADYAMTGQFIEAEDEPEPPPIVELPASNGYVVAVSASRSLAAVGHENEAQGHLSLFRLNSLGELRSSDPQRLALPRPDVLDDAQTYPTGLAFHPSLPLLYVWQDLRYGNNQEQRKKVFENFAHLLIYRLTDGGAELVAEHATGESFFYGRWWGALAVAPDGKRLYLPNLRDPNGVRSNYPAVGYYQLGDDGLPVDGEEALVRRALSSSSQQAGFGIVPVSDEVVILGMERGPATWQVGNARNWMNEFRLPESPGVNLIAGRADWDVIFITGLESRLLQRMSHVEGYLTLLPERFTIPGASLRSEPVIMADRNQIALGETGRIFILELDEQLRWNGAMSMVPATNPSIRALCYSEASGRLYVAVDEEDQEAEQAE